MFYGIRSLNLLTTRRTWKFAGRHTLGEVDCLISEIGHWRAVSLLEELDNKSGMFHEQVVGWHPPDWMITHRHAVERRHFALFRVFFSINKIWQLIEKGGGVSFPNAISIKQRGAKNVL